MSKKVNVDADDDIDVRDHPAAHRFDVWVGDQRAGFTHYVDRGNGVVAFVHTEIKPEFEHRGLAGRLIGEALAAARDRGWAVLPECPFVRAYLEQHRELVDLVPADERVVFGLD
jgi:predicted GNAT family acetyltransferase